MSRRVGDGLLGKTVLTRETEIVDNLHWPEDLYVDSIVEEGIQSTVYIPLVLKGGASGSNVRMQSFRIQVFRRLCGIPHCYR